MELLKQPLGQPLSMAEQVITLVAATGKTLMNVPVPELKACQGKMLAWFHEVHSEIVHELETTGELPDELRTRIVEAAKEFATTSESQNA